MTLQTTDRPLSARGLYQYHDVIGLLSAGQAGFSGPVSLAFGLHSLLYVASRANPNQREAVRITKCTKDGDYIDQFGQWGEAEGQFIWVTCIAFNQQGQLFLADENTHRVSVFRIDGHYLRCFGQHGSGDGQLDRPSGIAFDQNVYLYVVDTLNHR